MDNTTNHQPSSSSLLLSSLKDLLPEKNSVIIFSNRMKGLLAKSDGKDKTLALLQYLAMFTSNGTPGNALNLQKSFGSARKPFRIFKEVEFLLPVIENPPVGNQAKVLVAYSKAIGMSAYMAFDHIVFLGATGLVTNKQISESVSGVLKSDWNVGVHGFRSHRILRRDRFSHEQANNRTVSKALILRMVRRVSSWVVPKRERVRKVCERCRGSG